MTAFYFVLLVGGSFAIGIFVGALLAWRIERMVGPYGREALRTRL